MLCVPDLTHACFFHWAPRAGPLLMQGCEGLRFLFVGQVNESTNRRAR